MGITMVHEVFWKEVYIAAIRAGHTSDEAQMMADRAVKQFIVARAESTT